MTPTHCPSCEADLRYRDRDANGEEQEYSHVIEHIIMADDIVRSWRCPECQHTWRNDEQTD